MRDVGGSGAGHGGSIYRLSLDAMEIVYVPTDVKTGSGKESVQPLCRGPAGRLGQAC